MPRRRLPGLRSDGEGGSSMSSPNEAWLSLLVPEVLGATVLREGVANHARGLVKMDLIPDMRESDPSEPERGRLGLL